MPGVRSEDRGNWDKYLGVTKAMQGRLMRKVQSFFGTCRSTNSSLEIVDYFKTSEYFSG